jgi:hypothetical protein
MDYDNDAMQSGDDSGDGDGGLEYGDSADDEGYEDDQGDDGSGDADDTTDDGASEGGASEGGDAQYDDAYGSADGSATSGDLGSFDPSLATASVKTGLGDTLSSAWHAAGHLAHAGYDFAASTVHAAEAAGDAFVGDFDATRHRMEQAGYDSEDMRNQFHQAGQDLWGN